MSTASSHVKNMGSEEEAFEGGGLCFAHQLLAVFVTDVFRTRLLLHLMNLSHIKMRNEWTKVLL